MSLPRVGIAADLEDGRGPRAAHDKQPFVFLKTSYLERVREAGGAPVLLPYTTDPEEIAAVLDSLDALLVTGSGIDIPAETFGAERHPKQGRLVPEKTAFELALVKSALARDLPLLGICNGMQVINVACGGTLWQDLPSERGVEHSVKDATRPCHAVLLDPGSRTMLAMGSARVEVNSSHHQGVREVGRGLRVSGKAEDGTVEAIEDPTKRFAVGVQWHPELIPEVAGNRSLFRALVEAAQGMAQGMTKGMKKERRR